MSISGFVQKPGRYEVPSSTDVVQLISFAGGAIHYAKMDKVKITRLERVDSTFVRREYVLDLEELAKVEEAKLALYPGDTIIEGNIVDQRNRMVYNT